MFEGESGPKTKYPRIATVGKLQRHGEVFLYRVGLNQLMVVHVGATIYHLVNR